MSELPSFFCNRKRKSYKKVCENKDFYNVVVPPEDTSTEFNQYQKYDKATFIIYVDIECLIEKIDGWKKIRESSFTTKVSEHISSGFTKSSILSINYLKA